MDPGSYDGTTGSELFRYSGRECWTTPVDKRNEIANTQTVAHSVFLRLAADGIACEGRGDGGGSYAGYLFTDGSELTWAGRDIYGRRAEKRLQQEVARRARAAEQERLRKEREAAKQEREQAQRWTAAQQEKKRQEAERKRKVEQVERDLARRQAAREREAEQKRKEQARQVQQAARRAKQGQVEQMKAEAQQRTGKVQARAAALDRVLMDRSPGLRDHREAVERALAGGATATRRDVLHGRGPG
ncbi:hypothetical protein [Streptomyces sp. CA-106131]|uniref:hypothetical protein n=1 Tax=Streptomyces sp. CA-106131 TaxID=3240045 RepID=UPI003D8B0C7A